MRISRIEIDNFRNFEHVEVDLGPSVLLVGANASGKSNFVHALRLILDSSLSRRDRMLTADDFWRGDNLSPWKGREIRVSVDLTHYQENKNLRSFLDNYVADKLGVSRLTYVYKPRGNVVAEESREQDYEFRIYGGNDPSKEIENNLFRHLSIRFVDALRDAEAELVARRMPLRSLLELYGIDGAALADVVDHIKKANDVIKGIGQIRALETDLDARLLSMKEHIHELAPIIRLITDNAEDVVSALRVLLDAERMLPINRTSLGLANVLYLAMCLLEIEKRETISEPIRENEYEYIILALEEPEAHLHPHLQRLLFRDFLRRDRAPIILSTHSPHIASVAPLDSFVMFRQPSLLEGTKLNTTARLSFTQSEAKDLERYLDVSRAEILFSRAVILVEGDAEVFLVPALAHLAGYDLDRYGISVCNVHGTNFAPYAKLIGSKSLDIPFAVLTDGDMYAKLRQVAIPQGKNSGLLSEVEVEDLGYCTDAELRKELEFRGVAFYYGLRRSIELLNVFDIKSDDLKAVEDVYENMEWQKVIELLANYGIFANEWSFEPALVDSGFADLFIEIIEECDGGPRVISALRQHQTHGRDLREALLKQIDIVGKGRVAQRLSARLMSMEIGSHRIPDYVMQAVEYLIKRLESRPKTALENQELITDIEDDILF